MNKFLSALNEEISAIEAELAADPRFVKLKALKAAHAVYSDGSQNIEETARVVEKPQATGGSAMSPERKRALLLCAYRLQDSDVLMKTKELNQYLIEQGATLPGNNPQNNLSSLLHRSDGFNSQGRAGWAYSGPRVELEDEVSSGAADNAPQETAATPNSSAEMTSGGTQPNVRWREQEASHYHPYSRMGEVVHEVG